MKKDGSLRVVLDYRDINEKTFPDKYIIRDVRECCDEVGKEKSKIFSSLDLTSGFWQLMLEPDSRKYTAFTIPGKGRYEWVVTPMGLHGSPASFARLMDHVMAGAEGVITYLDDVLVHAASHQKHRERLQTCFDRIRKFGLKLNLKKCLIGVNKIGYLGLELTQWGVRAGEDKTRAVKEFPEAK